MPGRFQSGVMAAFAAIFVVAVFVSGCGGSSSSDSTGSSESTSSETSSETSGELDAAVTAFQSFVGGTSGEADSSKKPLTFGFLNDEGGTVSFPEGSPAADAAVDFINEYLGGIEGHPIAIEKCLIATGEEQGQTCAQQFRNSSAVLGTAVGADVVGAEAFQQTMAGAKPTIIGVPNSPADASAKNGYGLTAGVFGNIPGFTEGAKLLEAKTASVLFPGDDPTGQLAAKAIKEAFEAEGIKVTSAGFSSKASSLLAPVTASGAAQADVVIGLLPITPQCIAGAKALEQVASSTPVIALSTCAAASVEEALGELPHWTYMSQTENNLDPESSPDVAAYLEVMEHYVGSEANTSVFAQASFMGVLTFAKIANEVGAEKATSDSINTALKSYAGPTPMGPPLKPGGEIIPEFPALLTTQVRLYTYEGEDKWNEPGGAKWIG